ncbi:hypothetical protein SGPA1_20811 [Streptomyces misionensis JCM 4497]
MGGQALPHRPQRPVRHQVRPGPAVRRRRPAGGVLAGRPAGERRLRGPAALRLQAAADRGPRRCVGVGRRLHAQLPDPQGALGRLPRRPGGAGGAACRPPGPARRADRGRRPAGAARRPHRVRGLRRRGGRRPWHGLRAARPTGDGPPAGRARLNHHGPESAAPPQAPHSPALPLRRRP